jgi:hypothetical protein
MSVRRLGSFFLLCGGLVPGLAGAQVLRIGGFDFNANARLEGVYSSNVENVQPGTTKASMSDYFIVLGLDLQSTRTIGQGTTIDLSTGIAEEKHFKRSDLDNQSNPFGHFGLSSRTEVGHLNVNGVVSYERTSTSANDVFSTNGVAKTRDLRNTFNYGAGADYHGDRIVMSVLYNHAKEQHDLPQFQSTDQDSDRYTASVGYRVNDRFTPTYSYDLTKTEFPNNPANGTTQSNSRFIFPFILMYKPQLTYAFSWQREDIGTGVPPKWKPRHTISLSDSLQLSRSLELSYQAQYDNYPQPAQDLITFTYGASLSHQISRSASQQASITRQPVKTLGSTQQSDQTSYSYIFSKSDLFIYNLGLLASASKQHTIPEGNSAAEPVDSITYDATLNYRQPLSRNLTRSLEYSYSYQDTSTTPDAVVEHRVTLSYQYVF